MELMPADTASKILNVAAQWSAANQAIDNIENRQIRLSALAGAQRAAEVEMAKIAISAGLAQEPDDCPAEISNELEPAWFAIRMQEIGVQALQAARVAVIAPLFPTNPDL